MLRCPGFDLPHIQYQLDDPGEYIDEHISVIGGGDAGIENALGLAADPEQRNTVTIVNRGPEFSTAKDANVKALLAAQEAGRDHRAGQHDAQQCRARVHHLRYG